MGMLLVPEVLDVGMHPLASGSCLGHMHSSGLMTVFGMAVCKCVVEG